MLVFFNVNPKPEDPNYQSSSLRRYRGNPEDWRKLPVTVTDRVLRLQQAEDEGIELVTAQLLAKGGTAELIQEMCAREDAQITRGKAALEILVRKRFNN